MVLPHCARGYLRIHPSNPHYLQETSTGEAVMITSYTNIVPAVVTFDYVSALRTDTQSRRLNYCRVWHFTPWALNDAIWPWSASSTGGGYWGGLGGNKLNMNTFNTTYWTRMSDAMSRANDAGVYAEIMLFDRVGLSPAANNRWGNNPWAANNNINGLEVPNAQPPNDGTAEFYGYSTRPNLKNQQERYIRKMIDQTIAYPNVLYEIENEHWQDASTTWATHYGQFVKDYIAATYPGSPRLVSYNSLEADLDNLFTSSAIDIINKHYGSETINISGVINSYIEPHWGSNKPINVDEFANGVYYPEFIRKMCWEVIASGGHFHVEDADPDAVYDPVENIRSFKALANWNFIGAAPNKNLITSGGGFCLANPGEEYVCYFVSGGDKTVNLVPATYRSEWWNPHTGGFYGVAAFAHGGGDKSFSTPDANDWVLHVTNRPAITATLDTKPAGAITIDGNSSDWNLVQYITKIFAGNSGEGDTAIVGYNGFENWTCYAGAHAIGNQFPPTDAADHAVRLYSQHDADYLYFLIRLDDSDIQTPNPANANSGNDCVAFYIDPGNAGGANPMSNSTSDLLLVIDAANQKNVYLTTVDYAAQVLSGVTSAVSTDASGWWLEVRMAKMAFNPVIPATGGTIGIDFSFRDNDNNNNPGLTTIYTWHEMSSDGFPSTIADRWGKLNLLTPAGSPPVQASNPSPTNGSIYVAVNRALSWTAGSGATSHSVRVGTANPPPFVVTQTTTTYQLGTLTPNTTYYWRIDETNVSGTTTGAVWSFTTLPIPGQASSPNPVNAASNLSPNVTLSWTAGSSAGSHDVYFGTGSPGTFRGNQTGTSYSPGALSPNTTYYWRIDEKNTSGTTAGAVWSFTTMSLPGQAGNPGPAHGATGVSTAATLSWTPGSGATSHNVYLGTTSPPGSQGNQTGTSFKPAILASATTYYWRIDEVNAAGTTAGATWTFTTGVFSKSDFDGDGDVDQADFAHLQGCFGLRPIAVGCLNADLNSDTAIDESDLHSFLPCLNGTDLPPRC